MAIPPFSNYSGRNPSTLPGPTFLPAVKKTAECRKCDISAARLSTGDPWVFRPILTDGLVLSSILKFFVSVQNGFPFPGFFFPVNSELILLDVFMSLCWQGDLKR